MIFGSMKSKKLTHEDGTLGKNDHRRCHNSKISEWVDNIYDFICEKLTIECISICEPVSQGKP